MKITGTDKMTAFGEEHKEAVTPLSDWELAVENAEWKHTPAMKQLFGSANVVGKQTVFNIGGNKFRLIALINYQLKLVHVQYVLTHEEYDKGDWKTK